jgi:hypothetical protein
MYTSAPLHLHITHYHCCHSILVYFCLQKIVSAQFPTRIWTISYSKLTLCKRGTATKVLWDHIMGRVLVAVWDCSREQLLDAPGEINVFDHSLARSGCRRATWHSDKPDLWGNSSGPGGPLRRPTFCHHSQLKARRQGQGMLARICHSYRTTCPPCLPDTNRGIHKASDRQSFLRRRCRRPRH